MKTWKKNLVAAAVLVTVCTGIYVNWLYTEQTTAKDLTETLDAEKVMSDGTLILSGEDAVPADAAADTASDYFAAVRLSRQQAKTASRKSRLFRAGSARTRRPERSVRPIGSTASISNLAGRNSGSFYHHHAQVPLLCAARS